MGLNNKFFIDYFQIILPVTWIQGFPDKSAGIFDEINANLHFFKSVDYPN
jgi:hypothetical protein